MRQIRMNTFETNSSSCHTLVVCSKEEYIAWKNGELLLDEYRGKFKRKDEINVFSEEQIKKYYDRKKETFWKNWEDLTNEEREEARKKYLSTHDESDDYKTYDQYGINAYSDLESYYEEYTTKSGDEIVIFGEYGYDG